MEYEYDGHIYRLSKLKLSDAKECLAKLSAMGFFDKGLEALISSTGDLDELERRLFRANLAWLNESGEWVPLGKEMTERHFEGRLAAYLHMLIKAISHNFEDFLGGGWTTGLGAAESDPG